MLLPEPLSQVVGSPECSVPLSWVNSVHPLLGISNSRLTKAFFFLLRIDFSIGRLVKSIFLG